jgi:hypothetical protein
MVLDSREVVTVAVSSFTGHLGIRAANHADEIFKLGSIDTLTAYVRVRFFNEDLEDTNLYSLIKSDQFDKSLHEDTRDFKSSYSYWKDDISVMAATYLYIGGLYIGALQTNLMTKLHARKYDSLIDLQNDATKNSLWRSAAVNTPRNDSFATTHNKSKVTMPMPSYKRPHVKIGQSNHGSYGSFGGNGSKCAFNSITTWGNLRMQKQTSKVLRSRTFLIKRQSARGLHQVLRATTRGTRLRQSSLSTSSTRIVEPMIALIVARLAIIL